MKRTLLLPTVCLSLALGATVAQAALSLNFNSDVASTIQFNGAASSFQINNALPDQTQPLTWQWLVTSPDTSSAVGYVGWFTGGPWSYGAVTSSGNLQYADITTSARMYIADEGGDILSGVVNWGRLSTTALQGGINAAANFNITGLTYSGVDSELMALAAAGQGSINLSFNLGRSLTGLTTGAGPMSGAYSGSITAVPEPSTVVAGLGGLGLVVLCSLQRLRRPSVN